MKFKKKGIPSRIMFWCLLIAILLAPEKKSE
jgi:hypothetical protein